MVVGGCRTWAALRWCLGLELDVGMTLMKRSLADAEEISVPVRVKCLG